MSVSPREARRRYLGPSGQACAASGLASLWLNATTSPITTSAGCGKSRASSGKACSAPFAIFWSGSVPRASTAADERDLGRDASMCDGNLEGGGHGGERRDAGDDLEGDGRPGERLRLFAAAPEDERIAAL